MPATRGSSLDTEVDALFQRPLAEFISARNTLAARLRKEGRAVDAERVKALVKPSTPAWAVNQLFWENPKAFDRLVAVTERVRRAQTGLAKNADLAGLLDEKKGMIAELMTRASTILAASGHGASPDVMRRISATLESLAVWGRAKGGPQAGRLTADLDPPGFEALTAFMSGRTIEPARVLLFRAPQPREDPSVRRARAREAVQAAEKVLRDAQRAAERADSLLAKASARTAAVQAQKEEIEARYAEAKAETSAASSEAKKAAQAVADAERALARARAEVE